MAEAAREVLRKEIGLSVQPPLALIEPLLERKAQPWEQWLTHAATAAWASVITAMMLIMPWVR